MFYERKKSLSATRKKAIGTVISVILTIVMIAGSFTSVMGGTVTRYTHGYAVQQPEGNAPAFSALTLGEDPLHIGDEPLYDVVDVGANAPGRGVTAPVSPLWLRQGGFVSGPGLGIPIMPLSFDPVQYVVVICRDTGPGFSIMPPAPVLLSMQMSYAPSLPPFSWVPPDAMVDVEFHVQPLYGYGLQNWIYIGFIPILVSNDSTSRQSTPSSPFTHYFWHGTIDDLFPTITAVFVKLQISAVEADAISGDYIDMIDGNFINPTDLFILERRIVGYGTSPSRIVTLGNHTLDPLTGIPYIHTFPSTATAPIIGFGLLCADGFPVDVPASDISGPLLSTPNFHARLEPDNPVLPAINFGGGQNDDVYRAIDIAASLLDVWTGIVSPRETDTLLVQAQSYLPAGTHTDTVKIFHGSAEVGEFEVEFRVERPVTIIEFGSTDRITEEIGLTTLMVYDQLTPNPNTDNRGNKVPLPDTLGGLGPPLPATLGYTYHLTNNGIINVEVPRPDDYTYFEFVAADVGATYVRDINNIVINPPMGYVVTGRSINPANGNLIVQLTRLYDIEFRLEGGLVGANTGPIVRSNRLYGSTIGTGTDGVPANPSGPNTFLGWRELDANGDPFGPYLVSADFNSIDVTGPRIFAAQWHSDTVYDIIFDLNGGAVGAVTGTVTRAGRLYNSTIGTGIDGVPTNPTRSNRIFAGWRELDLSTNTFIGPLLSRDALAQQTVTGNRVFVAQWSLNIPAETPPPDPTPTPTPATPTPTPGPPIITPTPTPTPTPATPVPEPAPAFMIGFDDGLVRPTGTVTRAEAATFLFRIMTDADREFYWTQENPFADVLPHRWYNNAVSTTTNAGIFTGSPGDTFNPSRNITRAELAVATVRYAGLTAVDVAPMFSDISGHWAAGYINAAALQGWALGFEGIGGRFMPDTPITRAETAAMINRMQYRLPEGPEDLLPGMVTFPDNMNTRAWYYLYIQEAANSHYFVRKDDDIHITWVQLIPPRRWYLLERPDSRPEDIFR